MDALIYVGNGSRTESGNTQFISFVKEMMSVVDFPLQGYGFLEGTRPSIIEAISTVISQGATSVTIMPILLLTGTYVREDIPNEMMRAKKIYPNIPFYYGQPFGQDDSMIQILNERLEAKKYNNKRFKAVLLVSHGSYDVHSLKQFEEIAQRLRYNKPFDVFTCYMNMSKPSFKDELGNVLKQTYEEIYIIPYLLYSGGFTVEIENITKQYQVNNPDKNIILCEHIGFDEKLKELFQQRVYEAIPIEANNDKSLVE
ncbi:sirohydrochlorin chelatase [Bacillus sp. PS06]|uniref:sirohydrochlorin chelatase n=1 Tax=Bacillus sp. PS06 TaxID=2764176 RepID=UPI00177FF018|nr:sirohydrochlorin chelatase [Bacillus sp. PS06]MBD8070861.1 sirohydrochlorin chelatase [Bacillus sp. PS06]